MAGILSGTNSMLFPMVCDVYYAFESQDKYGKIVKTWNMDNTIKCSFYTLNDMSNNDNFDFDDKKFYRLETMLVGRTAEDIRKNSEGMLYPVSHILITNIRAACCNDELFFYETNGGSDPVPTVYEVKSIQPYIGPFNKIEYFKIQLERSDTQEDLG